MAPTLAVYVAWQFFVGILMAFLVITSVIMLVDFVELSRTLGGSGGMGISQILVMTFLKAPQLIEQTLSFVVLFGVMNALYKLNRRSELIIMRASGMSAWRFLLPGILVAGLIGVFWTAVMNPVSIAADAQFRNIRGGVSQSAVIVDDENQKRNIWMREGSASGQTVIFARKADIGARRLDGVTFYRYRFDDANDPVFDSRYDADTAQLSTSGTWTLTNVIETRAGSAPQPYEILTAPTTLGWDQLRDAAGETSTPQFWQLPAEIKKIRAAGFSAIPLQITFYRLLALPFTLIAMAIIAAGVSMQLTRLGGTLRLLILGSTLGFGVFFANNMMSAFGETGVLPALLSAWATPIFVLLVGLARLCTIEDG
ncbi:LPS export ABC transporter permease LptG [Robiginitomaculum antarcticum]|uniref:LPS export ABC transporter permease LptG n=1 Tax=Robiginitomaculum antarcticum TaxID=437507 RepID=UPI0003A8C7A6|nr:LPS export ABC transporter permease LptG [Robiginitomaculum antarcticum]